MTVGDYLSRLAVALPFIVALLAGLWYAARRGWIKPPGALGAIPGALLRPVATLTIGPGSRLVVVEFDRRHLLLAVSRTGTTLIDLGQRQ